MELEFDKEIDAILRKARSGVGTSVKAGHLDADTIAAFAENALPERAKVLYMEHFADCGRCRRQLSQSIRANREADAAAASTVLAAPETAAVPWYATLFKTQNLAIAMGSLVLVFSAVLGLMLLQRKGENAANNAAISQATEPDTGHGPYYSGDDAMTANTNAATATNPALSAPANASNIIASAANPTANTVPGATGKTTAADDKKAGEENNIVLDGITSGGAPKAAAPAGAPPPAPVDQPKTERENKPRSGEDEALKEKDLSRAESQDSRSRMDREAMPLSLKKVGPTRAGPLNSAQQQSNNSVYDMSVTRSVGGKTFANRSGAWYDMAYSGQSTIMIRRGSDDFKKLDGGLRSIANDLYGVVIVVWKGKAYRIV